MTLSKADRDAIARAVQRLRALFEEEFTRQATGRFGLHTDRRAPDSDSDAPSPENPEAELRRWVEPVEALALTPTQVIQRAELVGAIAYLRREGLDGGAAVTRLIREATFTATNRLLAVRVAEAIGVLPEVTAQGRRSSGYPKLYVTSSRCSPRTATKDCGHASRSAETNSAPRCRFCSIGASQPPLLSQTEHALTTRSQSSTIRR